MRRIHPFFRLPPRPVLGALSIGMEITLAAAAIFNTIATIIVVTVTTTGTIHERE